MVIILLIGAHLVETTKNLRFFGKTLRDLGPLPKVFFSESHCVEFPRNHTIEGGNFVLKGRYSSFLPRLYGSSLLPTMVYISLIFLD